MKVWAWIFGLACLALANAAVLLSINAHQVTAAGWCGVALFALVVDGIAALLWGAWLEEML